MKAENKIQCKNVSVSILSELGVAPEMLKME